MESKSDQEQCRKPYPLTHHSRGEKCWQPRPAVCGTASHQHDEFGESATEINRGVWTGNRIQHQCGMRANVQTVVPTCLLTWGDSDSTSESSRRRPGSLAPGQSVFPCFPSCTADWGMFLSQMLHTRACIPKACAICTKGTESGLGSNLNWKNGQKHKSVMIFWSENRTDTSKHL